MFASIWTFSILLQPSSTMYIVQFPHIIVENNFFQYIKKNRDFGCLNIDKTNRRKDLK